MKIRDIITLAFDSIKINISRTVITCLIITIGITALVGILTAVEAMEESLRQSFSDLGVNSFSIKNRVGTFSHGGRMKMRKRTPNITYYEAVRFKKEYAFPADISISVPVAFNVRVKSDYDKTSPNKPIIGVDEKYFSISGRKIEFGRDFTAKDVENSLPVAVIGADIAKEIFKNVNPVNKTIIAGNVRALVIGVLESKGSSFGQGEGQVYVPISYGRSRATTTSSYTIAIQVGEGSMLPIAVEEAGGTFRRIRKLDLREEDNFEISKSDDLANQFLKDLAFLTFAAFIIGGITIFGSAIGLLNIMLVTVTERTREIGVRKSLGANPSIIRKQFLYEAVTICVIGGLGGILIGVLIGNIISGWVGVGFLVPWNWVIVAFIICFLVGIGAGYYPASKAAKLDPIEALRTE